MSRVIQMDLEGKPRSAFGHRIKDQVAAILETDERARDDEDWLAARWLQQNNIIADSMETEHLRRLLRVYRKADIPRRRRELRKEYPYPDDEEERRQAQSRAGFR